MKEELSSQEYDATSRSLEVKSLALIVLTRRSPGGVTRGRERRVTKM
jgi:hypothetical protein